MIQICTATRDIFLEASEIRQIEYVDGYESMPGIIIRLRQGKEIYISPKEAPRFALCKSNARTKEDAQEEWKALEDLMKKNVEGLLQAKKSNQGSFSFFHWIEWDN